MKREMLERGRSQHRYQVVLEGDEWSWSNYRIITAVDRGGELTDKQWEAIESGDQHPGHFGGNVVRSEDNKSLAVVTVYVD